MHMRTRGVATAISIAVAASLSTLALEAQQPMNHGPAGSDHSMWQMPLGLGWSLTGMAQAYPIVTVGDFTTSDDGPLHATEWYLTQPALMANVEGPGGRVVLRTTLNFEGVTQGDGELTFGGWGEGFLDKRHPHTLLHEAMLSFNAWDVRGSTLSISAGKGFAPYGTDDPMARPGLKYPTNHHLSQILERWTLNAVWLTGLWSLEAGLFGGAEPTGPYDFSNIGSFGDSWSARVTRRWGGLPTSAPLETSASYGRVAEDHGGAKETTQLWNAAVRYDGFVSSGRLYALVEGSRSDPEDTGGHFSLVGEARYAVQGHQPYVRVEYATRPEYRREGIPTSLGFFRYDHDAEPIGATKWLITSLAYAREVSGAPWSVRPFIEVQHHSARGDRGGIDPRAMFGHRSFWAVSAGARVFLGGGPMRMGSYGALDAMTRMNRSMADMASMPGTGM